MHFFIKPTVLEKVLIQVCRSYTNFEMQYLHFQFTGCYLFLSHLGLLKPCKGDIIDFLFCQDSWYFFQVCNYLGNKF